MNSTFEDVRTCACGKTFVMRKHERTGTPNPISTYEVENGNVSINKDGTYRIIGKAEEYDGARFVSHFVDCELKDLFGRNRNAKNV